MFGLRVRTQVLPCDSLVVIEAVSMRYLRYRRKGMTRLGIANTQKETLGLVTD